jgi:hypothetical protein
LYSATVQVGRSAGVGMVWRSDSCITAKAPPGTGGRGAVSSSVSSGPGSFSWALSYNVAVVTSTMSGRVPGSGSRVVVVRGLGYGVSHLSVISGRLMFSASESSEWIADSSVACRAASGGNLAVSAFVAVSIQTGRGSCSGVMSYQLPQIVSADPANSPSSGSVDVLISGSSVGGGSDRSVRLRVGLSTLFRSMWRSDSAVGCRTVSGGGVRVDAALTVGSSAGSTSMLFSHNAFVPKPAAGSVGNVPSSGQTLVTVAGSGATGSTDGPALSASFSNPYAMGTLVTDVTRYGPRHQDPYLLGLACPIFVAG